MLSTNHCSTIPIMMNQIWWNELNYNLALIIPAVHIKAAVVDIQEAYLCGMQIVCWCLSAKPVTGNVISILFHVSENKFITTHMLGLRIPCRINYYKSNVSYQLLCFKTNHIFLNLDSVNYFIMKTFNLITHYKCSFHHVVFVWILLGRRKKIFYWVHHTPC